MRTDKAPMVGENEEFPIARKEEALNSRKLGGEIVPDFPGETSVIKLPGKTPKNTDGIKSKYPLQVSRPGERRL